jgi:hypothetical protein
MTLGAVIDNDVLIKTSCYKLIADLRDGLASSGDVGVLGAARYVVGRRLQRGDRIVDPPSAEAEFNAFLVTAQQLEPSADEVSLATAIEEAAALAALPFDAGESQLCAIAIKRGVPFVVSGDKRAISAAERIGLAVAEMTALANRLLCLEQAILALIDRVGHARVRSAVCAEPAVDKAITICCGCASNAVSRDDMAAGLISYISDLRAAVTTLLHPEDAPTQLRTNTA